jgi:hypothetical protein
MKLTYHTYILFFIIIFLYTRPRYISFLPTIPVYDNNEADLVYSKTLYRTQEEIAFFKLTDRSVSTCFVPHVEESEQELLDIITSPLVVCLVYFFKYSINRPRPYQINKNIKHLFSATGNTPALPAGHAFQAYYLAHILSKKYPQKKNLFNELAEKCDDVRVKAGIHYPSDGVMSKWLVNCLISLHII